METKELELRGGINEVVGDVKGFSTIKFIKRDPPFQIDIRVVYSDGKPELNQSIKQDDVIDIQNSTSIQLTRNGKSVCTCTVELN